MGEANKLPLTEVEIKFFVRALGEVSGPAHITDSLAHFVGFENVDDMIAQCERITQLLEQGATISLSDIRRSQLVCELMFASDIVGSGVEWETTTGISDVDGIRLLRQVQIKLLNARYPDV
jgi:hypothetical protein